MHLLYAVQTSFCENAGQCDVSKDLKVCSLFHSIEFSHFPNLFLILFIQFFFLFFMQKLNYLRKEKKMYVIQLGPCYIKLVI